MFDDFEVIRLCPLTGHVIQWDAGNQCEYDSGETLEEFGEWSLFPQERIRLGLSVPKED